MDQRILEFISDLRRAELRISTSEAMDALSASTEIGVETRETFKSALAATLVKEARDLPTFDRIFDLYFLDLRLEAFRRMIRQHVERELERRAFREGEKLTREVLTDKPLFALSPDEVAQMKAVVARLARKIKDALALRQRQEEKGRLDSRRTIRKSLQYGGIPMEVRYRRRHPEKPQLVTLCDVSDSVRNASRFMLQLVWSLQECFSRVRSYGFVSEIAEVTQAFNTYA